MTSEPRHFKDEVHDLVDGRLASELRSELDAHLAACAECRQELEAARWVKASLKNDLASVELPDSVAAEVASGLDRESGIAAPRHQRRSFARVLAAAAALVALASGGLLWRILAPTALPEQVAMDFLRLRNGTLELELVSSSEPQVEAFFTERGVPFPTRVFDFRMMEYEVMGGSRHRVGGRPSALFAYRGPGANLLLCQMYLGRVDELRGELEVRRSEAGIDFYVYRVGEVTVVFWQEGDVACVLASDAPAERAMALAMAKAVKI
jgi:anti-sigma factor RsiW